MAGPANHDEIISHDFLEAQTAGMGHGLQRGHVEHNHVCAALDQLLNGDVRRHDISKDVDGRCGFAKRYDGMGQQDVERDRPADQL